MSFLKPLYKSIPVLERYLLGELLQPLLLGVAAFALLGVSIGTAHEVALILDASRGTIVQKLLRACAVVALRTPFYVGLALPMASLLAPLLGLGRLGADNELGALHAIGVTARRLACLAAVLFMCVTTTHLLLAETVTPVCQRKAAAVVAQALRRLFHARSFDGTTMHNVTLVELLQQQQQHEEVVVEEEGSGHAPPPWGPQGLCAAAAAAAEGPALENVATDHTAAAAAAAGAAGLEGGEATSGKVERMVVAQAALWDAARLAWVMHHGTEYVLQHAPPVAAASSAREGPAERDTPPGDIPAHVALAGGGMWATPGSGWTSLRTVQSFTHRAFPGLPRVPLDLAESDGGRSLDDMTLAEVLLLALHLQLSALISECLPLQHVFFPHSQQQQRLLR